MGETKKIEISSGSQITQQKLYEKPEIRLMGDIRAFTLGPSFGTEESGGTSTKLKHPFTSTGPSQYPGKYPGNPPIP